MKHIVAVNASPRTEWNTGTLVREAARGAESEGADVALFDLYRLEKYTGCVSCFGCKLPENLGKCVCRDGLTPVLEAIRGADGLILGSPIYLRDLTAGFRALYERLAFQYITYAKEIASYNTRAIPVCLIVTSNCPEARYDAAHYTQLLEDYQTTLENHVGPTTILKCTDTLQVKDYSKYNWTRFDPAHKAKRHAEVFPAVKQKAFTLGAEIAQDS